MNVYSYNMYILQKCVVVYLWGGGGREGEREGEREREREGGGGGEARERERERERERNTMYMCTRTSVHYNIMPHEHTHNIVQLTTAEY